MLMAMAMATETLPVISRLVALTPDDIAGMPPRKRDSPLMSCIVIAPAPVGVESKNEEKDSGKNGELKRLQPDPVVMKLKHENKNANIPQ
jgi:hypothetical protein